MAERTDELDELTEDLEDREARAAVEEAQSVLDDIETSTGTPSSSRSTSTREPEPEGGGNRNRTQNGETEKSGGGLLPSVSLPSPSVPSIDTSELFSLRWFTVSLVASAAALLAGGFLLPILGQLGGYVSLLAVAFLLGLVGSDSHYVEMALGAAVTSGGFAVLRNLTFAFATGAGVPMILFGAGLGLVAAVVGYYFGRDLRAGLTRSVGVGGGSGGGRRGGGDDPPGW